MTRTFPRLIVVALLSAILVPRPAHATAISFEAADLADITAGEDLWRYRFLVSEFTFPENVAFEILFDPALYRDLDDPPASVNADWDILSVQPDPGVPDPGRYSALALMGGASLADSFTLGFVWLGAPGTMPGAQTFEINEFDAQANFIRTLEVGRTTPVAPIEAVPEPGSLILTVTGLAVLACRRKRPAPRVG